MDLAFATAVSCLRLSRILQTVSMTPRVVASLLILALLQAPSPVAGSSSSGPLLHPSSLLRPTNPKESKPIHRALTAGLEEDSEGALEPLAVRIRYIRDKQELVRVASIEDLTERLGAETWGLEDFLRHRPSRDTSILVAEHEKRIVGFLVYQRVYSEEDELGPMQLEEIRILNLGVHPDFQGQEVERQLIEWLILESRRQRPLVPFSFTNHVLDEQAREPFLNLGFKAKPIPDHFGKGEDAYELVLRPTASEKAHPNAIQLAAEWDRLQRFGGEKQIRSTQMTSFLEADSAQMRARYVVGFLAEISHRRQILERRNRKVIPSAILHAPEVRDFLRLITQSPPAVRKMVWTLRWMRRDPSLAPVVSRLKETLTWLTEAASRSRSRTVEPASKNLNLLLEAVTGTGAQGQLGPSIPPGQPPSASEGQTESAGLEETSTAEQVISALEDLRREKMTPKYNGRITQAVDRLRAGAFPEALRIVEEQMERLRTLHGISETSPFYWKWLAVETQVQQLVSSPKGPAAAGLEELPVEAAEVLRRDPRASVTSTFLLWDRNRLPLVSRVFRLSGGVPRQEQATVPLVLAQRDLIPSGVFAEFRKRDWQVRELPEDLTSEKLTSAVEMVREKERWAGPILIIVSTRFEGAVTQELLLKSPATAVALDPGFPSDILLSFLNRVLQLPGRFFRLEYGIQAGLEGNTALATQL